MGLSRKGYLVLNNKLIMINFHNKTYSYWVSILAARFFFFLGSLPVN